MTARTTITLTAGIALLATLIAPAPAHATRPCLREAKRDFRDCGAACKETLQADKDACLNRDHACVEICRAERSECRLETNFDALIDACNDILETRRAACRAYTDDEERDRCIDAAQVEAFQCRDAARELAWPLLKQCRKRFRACARACPPAGGTPVDLAQCLSDASAKFTGCTATCRELFQVAKDDCRHRDHDCVEECRAARALCAQPVREQLALDLGACAATRDADVAICVDQFPPPRDTSEEIQGFDACVDAAQVKAFVCRDNAHEAARPGLLACRTQFRNCVETNCPILP